LTLNKKKERKRKKERKKNKGIFEILKTNSPYFDPKNLEVARFRQCVPVGRHN
jgi:hypothetical protein